MTLAQPNRQMDLPSTAPSFGSPPLVGRRFPTLATVMIIAVGCGGNQKDVPLWHGELAALADSLMPDRAKVRCIPIFWSRDFGSGGDGCWWRGVGDTVVYVYTDVAQEVTMVGRVWRGRTDALVQAMRADQRELERRYGEGGSCQYDSSPFWSIDYQYWRLDGRFLVTILEIPASPGLDDANSKHITMLHVPSCTQLFSVPYSR